MTAPETADPVSGAPDQTRLTGATQLLAKRTAELVTLSRQWQRIGNLRLVIFALILGGAVWWLSNRGWLPAGLTAGLALVFAATVLWHRSINRHRQRSVMLTQLAREHVWRLERNWDELPCRNPAMPDLEHPYAADLDLFGHGSLLHLIDTTVTPTGQRILAQWLLEPAAPDTIRARQQAVSELADLVQIREELAIAPRLAGDTSSDPASFIAWAEGSCWLDRRWWLRLFAIVSPLMLAGFGIAQLLGFTRLPLWIVPLAANLVVAQLTAASVAPRLQTAFAQRQSLRGAATLLHTLNAEPFQAPLLRELATRVQIAGRTPAESLRHLARISRWWMPQSSLAWLPVQGFLVWDLHHLGWLERWQRQAGANVGHWLETAGELEALAALAGLAADHPDWVFPEIAPETGMIDADALGHPLLPDDLRVTNDLQIGPPGTFLLVTGSNMSGKSTLLRSLGMLVVMANMGAPVCARRAILPPLALWTSVRVQDSLTQGISFYMAELLRLKQIVDAANSTGHGRRLCFVLDELLQGTNTAERQIAARRIIRHLVGRGAIGAVSTHDLTLAEGPEIAGMAIPVHLTETIEQTADGPIMAFDYHIRPGLATSTNALQLMDVVGFAFDDRPTPHLGLKQTARQSASPHTERR